MTELAAAGVAYTAGAALLAVALGLVAGSLANVVISRMPLGQSLWTPPSHCPRCGHRLGPADLVPVLSYLWLRGRCRYCLGRIPARYVLVEAVCGAGFGLLWQAVGRPGPWAAYATLLLLLVILGSIDLEHGILPDRLTVPGLALGLVYAGLGWTVSLLWAAAGAFAGGLVVLGIRAASRGGMGMGDAKLLAMVGAYLGPWGALAALVWGCAVGSAVGIGLVLARRAHWRQAVPFGPFLAVGALLAALSVGRWPLPGPAGRLVPGGP